MLLYLCISTSSLIGESQAGLLMKLPKNLLLPEPAAKYRRESRRSKPAGSMLRLAGRRLAGRACQFRVFSTSAASLAEEGASEDKGPKAFIEKFSHNVSSQLADPNFPSSYLPKEEEKKEGVPEKLTLNFYLPHKQTLKNDKVRLDPAVSEVLGLACEDCVYLESLAKDFCWRICSKPEKHVRLTGSLQLKLCATAG